VLVDILSHFHAKTGGHAVQYWRCDFFNRREKMGKRAILTGLTVSLVALGSANAADLGRSSGSLKDVPYVETTWNWAGYYGGLTAGYGAGTSRNYVENNNEPHGWANNDPSGVLLGGTVGYNYNYAPNWVIGAEADLSWSGMEGEQHKFIYDGHEWSGGWDGFSTLRGRVGYATGQNLFYVTGGLALVHANEVVVGNNSNESNFYNGWKAGYVIGAGIEHAFTDRLSGKVEYLYADGFGNESGITGIVDNHSDQAYTHEIGGINVIRVGLNYKIH
jgi:outer membrane immunogenic protein